MDTWDTVRRRDARWYTWSFYQTHIAARAPRDVSDPHRVIRTTLKLVSTVPLLAAYNISRMLLQILHNIFLWIYFPVVFAIWAPIGVLWGLLSPPFRHRAHKISQFWSKFVLLPALGTRLQIQNDAPDVSGPCIYMSNHQSYLDIIVLLASLPGNFSFIAKKELLYIPLLGWYIAGAGHIFIEREDSARSLNALRKSLEVLKAGGRIIIFPEGTRGPGDTMLPFKRGGFVPAAQSGVPIVPIRITGTKKIMPKGSVWIRVGNIRVHIGKPMVTANISGNKKEREKELMARVRATIEAL